MYLKPQMFFDILQTEEVKDFLKTSFYVSCGSGNHKFPEHHIKMFDEMCCTCVGRGACSSHMKPCAARSPFSIQSWSTKRAWLGNSGHSSMRQDKVRRGHTLEDTPAHCGWCVIVIVSVYRTNPVVCLCFFIRLYPCLQHPVTSAVFMSSGFHSFLPVPYI